MADLGNEEEWELVNDCGFVYKRKKRPRLDSTSSSSAPPDPAVEEKNRRERKKRTLTKLKERYLNEIHKWEHLSNTLEDMQDKAQNQHEPSATASSNPPVVSSDSTSGPIVDDLLAQAEAHEAIIRDASYLCDVAESLSNAQEERVFQSFIDLPIWTSSPRELLSSLCDD